jgi:hypothetical protein
LAVVADNSSNTRFLKDHFEEPTYTRWFIPPTRAGTQTPLTNAPKAVQYGRAMSLAIQPILSRGRDRESPCQSVSTWITNHRKEPKTLIELRGNPFFSMARKKLTYIFILYIIFVFILF